MRVSSSASHSARVCLTGTHAAYSALRTEERYLRKKKEGEVLSSSGSVSMGCSSSSTQPLAQENRPRVKAEDASGETLRESFTHIAIKLKMVWWYYQTCAWVTDNAKQKNVFINPNPFSQRWHLFINIYGWCLIIATHILHVRGSVSVCPAVVSEFGL